MRNGWASYECCIGLLILGVIGWVGCAQIRVPQIDPVGRGVLLPAPNSTTIMTPFQQAAPRNNGPAFRQPPAPASCKDGKCGARLGQPHIQPTGALISHGTPFRDQWRKRGSLIMTPSRIVAPVDSEVVVMAGICGGDGYFIINQPLEWMLSRDSVGNIIEVGGTDHQLFNRLVKPSSEKVDADYAKGRTSLKPKHITRGTETPGDDLKILKGQAWLSLSSSSAGTSYLTCVAPKTGSWPERKSTTRIHWVDGIWSIPVPSTATAGTIHPLAVSVNRSSDGSGVAGWKVRYQIVGGVPAEFHPQGTQIAEVTTGANGTAPVQIRQPAGQTAAGQTQVRVDVIRPPIAGERELVLESGITSVTWSTPALTIRAIGPREAGINQAFNYRIEITNPGDQVARGVIVSTDDLGDRAQYISSTPKPNQYGNRYEWSLGDVQPGAQPRIIDLQLRSDLRGPLQVCFQVASQSDQLQTEACAETMIAVPCIGLAINGPTQAKVAEQISFNFDISNQCDDPLENVRFRLQYDPGLQAVGLPNPIEYEPIETILPGETLNLRPLTFQTLQGGTHCFNIEIVSAGGDTARARRCIEVQDVVEPKVRLEMESHGAVRVGQQVLVRMKVTNVGSVPLENVSVINKFSRSLTPVQRSPYPQRWIGDDLAFDIGRLELNQEAIVEILFDANSADGNAFSRATVTTPLTTSEPTAVSIRIDPDDGSAPSLNGPGGDAIRIPGDPAGSGLRVNVTALDRTIAVNNEATIRVSIQNDRAVTDQQVEITLLVPNITQLQPPDPNETGLRVIFQSPDGTEVRFEPRREMKAGEILQFNLRLRGVQAGQAIFAVQAKSARSPGAIENKDTITIVE